MIYWCRLLMASIAVSSPLYYPPATPVEISVEAGRTRLVRPVPQIVHLHDGSYRCTGFIIGHNLVATAAHCVKSKSTPTLIIEFDDGEVRTAKPLYVGDHEANHEDDVAILKADTRNISPLSIRKEPVQYPELCFFSGYASTETQSLFPCSILGEEGGQYKMVAQPRPGDSGGPVYGPNGEIIGVISRYSPIRPYFGLATKLEKLQHALESLKEAQ